MRPLNKFSFVSLLALACILSGLGWAASAPAPAAQKKRPPNQPYIDRINARREAITPEISALSDAELSLRFSEAERTALDERMWELYFFSVLQKREWRELFDDVAGYATAAILVDVFGPSQEPVNGLTPGDISTPEARRRTVDRVIYVESAAPVVFEMRTKLILDAVITIHGESRTGQTANALRAIAKEARRRGLELAPTPEKPALP